ncbi:hypothetical protein Theco_4121 (plasmid) [Thermobacillus composti KWC4]|jgi:hypothetical protein|uniref:Uncharacterized protein n=1 Tax=Thermobacillus composti (strain DSM 18247 / JCM 13945 / KWC4) TaxID=717605 RepID=L0EKP5_THECK|nr:hypothetical protein [Thermobacillus composti]AGA60117.1 hypothetical protein Theco_4121 [Thermobacillus composti KWC4]
MGGYRNNNYQDGAPRRQLDGPLAERLMKQALEERQRAIEHIEDVYKTVPDQYHKHIRLLSQKQKLYDAEFELTNEQRSKGLQSYKGKTFVEIFRPYFDVEGRITEMIDVHEKHGSGYRLDTYAEQIGPSWVIECVFEGLNKKGQPVKTRDRAVIAFGGSGVDSTNPIENATTSAIGRALAQAGFGIVGSGLSTVEDIAIAYTRQKALEAMKNGSVDQDDADNVGEGAQRSVGGHQTGRTRSDNESRSGGQQRQDDPARLKNDLVRRLIDMTKGMNPAQLKNRVSMWLKITWNGKFNSLEVGQLRLIEEHLKAERQKQEAS